MYSILLSKIEKGIELIKEDMKENINNDSKALILPWAFPVEINSDKLINDFFSKNGHRYPKYIDALSVLGIKEKNIIVGDCYSHSKEQLKDYIAKSDIILLPGGNPEMMFKKILHDTEILYDLKNYKGVIIGESAGAELQLKRYFITEKNNFYDYFAFYDGFGILDDPFYFDVHSIQDDEYLEKLKSIGQEKKKDIYAIFDDGALVYNRETKKFKTFGHTIKLEFNDK